MAERWERSSTPGARSVAWSRSAVPEEMDLVIKRGTKPGDIVSAQAPSGRVVMIKVPDVVAAQPGVEIVATVPVGYDGASVVNGRVNVWRKGRGMRGRWDDADDGGGGKEEDEEEEEEEAEEEAQEAVVEEAEEGGSAEQRGRRRSRAAIGWARSTSRSACAARSRAPAGRCSWCATRSCKGKTDHYIDPVLLPPNAASPATQPLAAVRQLEDRGWVYAPEEAVELMLYYENPDDGSWFPLTDGAYCSPQQARLATPQAQLRPKKTPPTRSSCCTTTTCPAPDRGLRAARQRERQAHGHAGSARTRRCSSASCAAALQHGVRVREAPGEAPGGAAQLPWPGCPYRNTRRGPLKLHWKTHMSQDYRLCADGVGRNTETGLIGHFHTLGIEASGDTRPSCTRYTPSSTLIWTKHKTRSPEDLNMYIQATENAVGTAKAMAAGAQRRRGRRDPRDCRPQGRAGGGEAAG